VTILSLGIPTSDTNPASGASGIVGNLVFRDITTISCMRIRKTIQILTEKYCLDVIVLPFWDKIFDVCKVLRPIVKVMNDVYTSQQYL
jgi:hypothetical protein